MKEKNLLKIALVTSLIGIFIILIVTEKADLFGYSIAKIDKSFVDRDVRIEGEIVKIKETPGLLILDVRDETGSIKVVAFKEEKIELKKGNKIEIEGKVREYRNELEIEAIAIKLS